MYLRSDKTFDTDGAIQALGYALLVELANFDLKFHKLDYVTPPDVRVSTLTVCLLYSSNASARRYSLSKETFGCIWPPTRQLL